MKVSSVLFLMILCVIASTSGYPPEQSQSHVRRSSEPSSKFEEVYRWKQISFTPLDNGMLTISRNIARKIHSN